MAIMKKRYELHKTNGNWEESYPNQKYKKQGDCVVRAIAIATEQPYKTVLSDLCAKGIDVGSMPNSPQAFVPYLEELGFKEHKLPKSTRMDSDLIPRDRYVVCYVAKHLACIKGFDLFDTWDCSWTYAYKDNKPISKIVTRIYYKD